MLDNWTIYDEYKVQFRMRKKRRKKLFVEFKKKLNYTSSDFSMEIWVIATIFVQHFEKYFV